jgi:glycopeptide antibiotics resistance protein
MKIRYNRRGFTDTSMKLLSKTVFIVYILVLLWLVLFKFSYDIASVVLDHQTRSLHLIPFTSPLKEAVDNLIIFIPFGLLLSVNLPQITLWQKLAFVSIFSVTIEVIQFILAIGVTDITDVITNTAGGLVGLMLYDVSKKHVDRKRLDRFIVAGGAILLIALILLRLVLKVQY